MKTLDFVTSLGKKLALVPIAPFILESYRASFQEQFDEANPAVERPTYEFETMGGGKERLPHDETTLTSDEDRAAWKLYQDYISARDSFLSQKMLDAMIVESVDVDPMTDQKWLQNKRFFKVKLSDDPVELKLQYVKEQLAADGETGGDFLRLANVIGALSGVSEKALNAAKGTFRNSSRSKRRAVAGSAGEQAEEEVEVVQQSAIPSAEDGEVMGSDS